MSLQDRESKRKTSIVGAMLSQETSNAGENKEVGTLKDTTNLQNNEVIIETNNELNTNIDTVATNIVENPSKNEVEKLKAKSYYISDTLYKAVNLRSVMDGVDKSAVVRAALEIYLRDELEKIRNNEI